ncbi:hypothetical protein [Leptospira sp. GIMC2001]|uniref:hypothetical protein n=1 Tax=Leptospira sp. GIMC2001 TaxID=1513297 RepID=UPI0023492808|nr:hypothetical protein [Leptospira sp. GIMC2001]WCL47591.1 hypothetical protein O4O04_01085 [Leptospira sp. GIMC2001]
MLYRMMVLTRNFFLLIVLVFLLGHCAPIPTNSSEQFLNALGFANYGSQSFQLGGRISGLQGTGLQISNSISGTNLAITDNGNFVFAEPISINQAYNITITNQPTSPAQECVVTGGEGTALGNIETVSINCDISRFSIGGTVENLKGSGFQISLNSVQFLSITSNGTFAFPDTFISEQTYSVTVTNQPTSPPQTCLLENATGTTSNSNITNIRINCLDQAVVASVSPSGLTMTATAPIVITFNKAMQANSCTIEGSIEGDSHTETWSTTSSANDTLTLTPTATWGLGINRNLIIQNCLDVDGLLSLNGFSLRYEGFFSITATVDAIRYVSNSGNNAANNCTNPASPCLTIEYAYNLLTGVANCATNHDCAVFIQSGNYFPTNTIALSEGVSLIGSRSSNFFSSTYPNTVTGIFGNSITGCGNLASNYCRTILVQNVSNQTQISSMAVLGKPSVEFATAIQVGNSGNANLRSLQITVNDTNLTGSSPVGVLINGTGLTVNYNYLYVEGGNATGTGSTTTAMLVDNSPSINLTMTGSVLGIKNANTVYGFRLQSTSIATINLYYISSNRNNVGFLPNSVRNLSFDGNLSQVAFNLIYSNIQSFNANETSIAIDWNSTNAPTAVQYLLSNNITTGSISLGTGQAIGINYQRLAGILLNNRIVGGEFSGAGSPTINGIRCSIANDVRIWGNSIASGRGSSSHSAVFLGAGCSEASILNNNLAGNSDGSSVCILADNSYANGAITNNNFHSCAGAHFRVDGGTPVNYFVSNCAGTGTGNLASGAGCTNTLSAATAATVAGNIDQNASFLNTGSGIDLWNWDLRLRTDGTTPCILSRGARSLTPLLAMGNPAYQYLSLDIAGNTRTQTSTTGINNLPVDAAGISIGSYENDGFCQN